MVLFLSKYKEKFQAKIPQLEFKIQIHFGTIKDWYQCYYYVIGNVFKKKMFDQVFCCAISVSVLEVFFKVISSRS